MKIAFFTDTYHPQVNGVVRSIDTFAGMLRSHGHEVHIFCPSGVKRSRYVHPIHSTELRSYPEYRVGLPTARFMKEFEKVKPDVIHIHSPFTIGLFGVLMAKMTRIPIVATYHTMLSEYLSYAGNTKCGKDVAGKFTKIFFDFLPILIVPSNSIKNILEKEGVKTHIVVMPTPLNMETFKRPPRKNRRFTILHVGRICAEKRLDLLIKSFKDVQGKIDSRLIITSDGPDRKRLEFLCKKLGVENNVVFTGYISDRALRKLYSTADVFVSASDTETQGLVLLEAMACGCPSVVRNALGFKDYIQNGKNGVLFDTCRELSNSILKISGNKKFREEIVSGGYATVENISGSKSLREIEQLYRSVSRKSSPVDFPREVYAASLLFMFMNLWLIKNMHISINPGITKTLVRIIDKIYVPR